MIVSGLEFKNSKPFSSVYFTGLVRDKQGRKMSKQLGNSPDAVKLIKDFGADSVRVGLLLSAPGTYSYNKIDFANTNTASQRS